MNSKTRLYSVLCLLPALCASAAPAFPEVTAAMRSAIDAHDMPGAVTVVVTKEKVLHLEAIGMADLGMIAADRGIVQHDFLRAEPADPE